MRSKLAAALVVATALVSAPVLGALDSRVELPIDRDLSAAGWRELTLPDKDATRYVGQPDGTLAISADSSVSFLLYDVSESSEGSRYLSWRWRVDKAPPPSDLAKVGEDDRPIAVHLLFPEDRPSGLFGFIENIAADMFGLPAHGKVLTYVWGGIRVRGEVLANPHLEEDGTLIVLRPGSTPMGQWFTEEIDFRTDFERLHGYAPPALAHVAISADSDDTPGQIMAALSDLSLSGRPLATP